jgi:Putative peptidoglycan binding domain
MSYRSASSSSTLSRVFLLVLGLGTVSGWAMCGVSTRSAAEIEIQLRAQVTSLHQIQMDLLNEKEQTKAAVGELEPLRAEIAKLRSEADLLTQARDLARAELVAAATGMKDLMGKLNRAGTDVSLAESINTSAIGAQELVAATAQKALSKRGYDPLKADGIVGPSTQRAVTAFQRANNLHVTGELNAPTLRLLVPGETDTL